MKKKLIYNAMIVFALIMPYLLLGPLEVFSGNMNEFYFGKWNIVLLFLGGALFAEIVGILILTVIPEKISKVLSFLFFAFGVCSYIQGLFLNKRLSNVDGSGINWREQRTYIVIATIIWIVLFLAIVIFLFKTNEKLKDSVIKYVSLFLIGIQLVAYISLLVTVPNEHKSDLILSGEEQFDVAKNDNIIVFVLDTFSNDLFDEVTEKYPELLDVVKDFTFYNNADCHYYCTFPSMTHMLTGNEVEFETPKQEWLDNSWSSERTKAFYGSMRDSNYKCYLYSDAIKYEYGSIENIAPYFDNVINGEIDIDYSELAFTMTKMMCYRYFPYITKPYLEVLTCDFDNTTRNVDVRVSTHDNTEFYRTLKLEEITVNPSIENAFMVHLLFGVHDPYTTGKDAIRNDEATLEDVVQGLFVIIDEYCKMLKDIGKYDDTTIIITADHGLSFEKPQPLFLIKERNQQFDSLRVNTAPISLDDLQATIASIANADVNGLGSSIYDWNEEDTRERTVYMRAYDEKYPDTETENVNVFYGYSYTTNRDELFEKMTNCEYEVKPYFGWKK